MCYRLIFYLKLINNKFSLFILSVTSIEINLLTTFSFVNLHLKIIDEANQQFIIFYTIL